MRSSINDMLAPIDLPESVFVEGCVNKNHFTIHAVSAGGYCVYKKVLIDGGSEANSLETEICWAHLKSLGYRYTGVDTLWKIEKTI